MNRGYTREVYLEKIERLREHCPGIALSTDIIVGFPKESDADFEQTMALLRAVEFDLIFAFAYSDRSSAPAAKFPDQVDEAVKRERLNRLLALQETYTEKKNQQLVGEIVELLVEGRSQKQREGLTLSGGAGVQMFGRTGGNKIVHFPSENVNIGDVLEIKIENAYPHSLWGLPVEPETK